MFAMTISQREEVTQMNVKSILIFAGGAAFGAVASFFITRKRVEDTMAKVYMEAYVENKKEAKNGEKKPKKAENLEKTGKNEPENEDKLEKWKPNVTSKDLLNARNDAATLSKDEGYFVEPAKPCNEIGADRPYLIEEDDFGVSIDYSSDDVTWWSAGGFATDMDYNKIENLDELVGMDNIETLVSAGVSYGYVRNESTKQEFTVLLTNEDPPMFLEDD